ncbi:MAG: alanine--tRNA ligase, partial [Candidatus Omnitrophica bacterium]|nr:alanine--tRNA ligase [Candidatus Omnitrophota bacterium]
HHTFFELLGNFSFGDYFKQEAIQWAWEFVVEILKIGKEKIWVSYYSEDSETLKIWKKLLPESRIVPLGKKDNFWGPAGDTGPCGPCTEIYIDFGIDPSCENNNCKPGCDCNRFLEFWNLVFPQYNQQTDGSLQPLKRKGVDTGMGLERIARIMQGKNSNYETDLFIPLINQLEKISGLKYDKKTVREFRIIVDHVRAMAFLISDGVYPDNEGRGYVLKRIIRRAYFQGTRIGFKEPFLTCLVEPLALIFANAYYELNKHIEEIKDVIYEEEKKFSELLYSARKIFKSETSRLHNDTIPGEVLFRWYDTYGIPRDLISDLAEESNLKPDWHTFEQFLRKQQEKSRRNSVFEQKRQVIFDSEKINETTFTGYQTIESKCEVVAFYHLVDRNLWELILDSSPFYPEKGGQVGDKGTIKGEKWDFEVFDTQIDERGVIFHIGKFRSGNPQDVRKREQVIATVSCEHRMDVAANHTATHLLHFCLRRLSNNHAKQAGSYVGADKLRFDFIYPEPIGQETVDKLETCVNRIVFENRPVKIEEMDYQEALKSGAIALFTEKYGERVRVVKTGDFHAELCGGTHVQSTSEIGIIKITCFSSIGENLKRIEAVTRETAYNWFKKHVEILLQASNMMKTPPENLSFSINKLKKQMQDLEKRFNSIIEKSTMDIATTLKKNKKDIQIKNQVIHLIAGRADGITFDQLGKIADLVSSDIKKAVVFLAGTFDEKVVAVCKVTPDISNMVQAHDIIQQALKILNGSGGGKPDFARGSGKNITKIDDAISRISGIISDIYGRKEIETSR